MPGAENRFFASLKVARGGNSRRRWLLAFIGVCAFASSVFAQQPQVLNDPVDVSQDFQKFEQVYFIGSKVTDFNPATGRTVKVCAEGALRR